MEMIVKVIGLVWALSAMVALSGCGFVQRVDMWGFKMEFSKGINFNFGANEIDKVDDRKGLNKF